MNRLAIGCCLIALSALAQAGVYRWTDANGDVHYGDRPEASAHDSRALAMPRNGMEPVLSYAVRRARKTFPATLYVAANCIEYCSQARALLQARGIPFDEVMLDQPEAIAEFKATSGGEGVPALQLGAQYFHGLNAARWENELDLAGYPPGRGKAP